MPEPPRDESARRPAEEQQPDAAPDRAAYSPPRLTVYGGIEKLTRTIGPRGRRDSRGRWGGNRRTGF